MVVDIGAHHLEIAVLSMNGETLTPLKVAGDAFDEAIALTSAASMRRLSARSRQKRVKIQTVRFIPETRS